MYASKKDEILADLFLKMPYFQRHCDTLKSERPVMLTSNKRQAAKSSYISLNNAKAQRVDYLLIDCDHEDIDNYPDILPRPLLTVANKHDGKHHHVFPLEVGVLTGEAALRGPKRKLKLVQEAVDWALDGDPNYNRFLTKNPFHLGYDVIPGDAKFRLLSDFDRVVDAYLKDRAGKPRRSRPRRLSDVIYEGSWNTYLFNVVRFTAMDRGLTSRLDIMRICEEVNWQIGLDSPKHIRPDHELKSITNSISRWMNTKWTPGKRLKVLDLSPNLSTCERQAAGGVYVANKRADETREMVLEVLTHLLMSGESHRGLSMKIAGITGIALKSVQKHVKEFIEGV